MKTKPKSKKKSVTKRPAKKTVRKTTKKRAVGMSAVERMNVLNVVLELDRDIHKKHQRDAKGHKEIREMSKQLLQRALDGKLTKKEAIGGLAAMKQNAPTMGSVSRINSAIQSL